jgi:glycosyltransferase involved in cell wall biosynthesis
MRPHIDSRLGRLRRYEEVLALSTPADLCIMTDDGTQGDEVLQKLNPGLHGRLRFWRNGLDLGHVRPPSPSERDEARMRLGLKAEDLVMVTAARLARWKRIDRAIDALALLSPEYPNARLYVVGDGEERQNLERQAGQLGLDRQVLFAGAVPQAAVRDYLWAADVFLSVNELSNVGNPLLEALASGRCIVTLDEGDTRELITNGVNGVLLGSGAPAQIAAALQRLAASPKEREALARGAEAYASRNLWTWEQRLDAEMEAVEGLVAGRAAPVSHA